MAQSLITVVVVAICASTVLGKETKARDQANEQCFTPESNAKGKCDYQDIGTQVQCLGSTYKAGKMTDQELKAELFKVIKRLPSDDTFYSIGLEFAKTTGIVIGKQSHYQFDWNKKIGTDPRDFYYDHTYLMPARPLRRSMLVFLAKPLQKKLRVVSTTAPWVVNAATGLRKEVFQSHESVQVLGEDTEPDCSRFETWQNKLALADSNHIAIVADASLWCPTQNGVLFDVAVGEYELDGDELLPISEVTRTYAHGPTIPWKQEDFY